MLAAENGGRWSEETALFLGALAAAYVRRWSVSSAHAVIDCAPQSQTTFVQGHRHGDCWLPFWEPQERGKTLPHVAVMLFSKLCSEFWSHHAQPEIGPCGAAEKEQPN